MKTLYIILSVVAIVTIWVAWVVSSPRKNAMLTAAQQAEIDSIAPASQCSGNNITDVFTNFAPMIKRLHDDIAHAEHHVHMQFFKFEPDSIGQYLGSLMAKRASEGVACRLLYDGWMGRPWRWYYRHLDSMGVETAAFGKVTLPFFGKKDNYRNHRKIIVIDGRIAYIGGMNIAERYMKGLEWGVWDDIMVRLEGPAVTELQRIFVSDWLYTTDSIPVADSLFPHNENKGSTTINVLASGPIGYGPTIMDHIIDLLDNSKHYVYFESPYFIPTPEVRQALLRAARRGVDIRVLQPPRGDQGETSQHASHAFFDEALKAGIRIGIYADGYMHSKLIVADDTLSIITSANIDYRSYRINQEVALSIPDKDFAAKALAMFKEDEQHATYIDPTAWSERPLSNKIKEKLARIIAFQL